MTVGSRSICSTNSLVLPCAIISYCANGLTPFAAIACTRSSGDTARINALATRLPLVAAPHNIVGSIRLIASCAHMGRSRNALMYSVSASTNLLGLANKSKNELSNSPSRMPALALRKAASAKASNGRAPTSIICMNACLESMGVRPPSAENAGFGSTPGMNSGMPVSGGACPARAIWRSICSSGVAASHWNLSTSDGSGGSAPSKNCICCSGVSA